MFVIVPREMCLFYKQVTCRGLERIQSLGRVFRVVSHVAAQAMCVLGGKGPQLLGE